MIIRTLQEAEKVTLFGNTNARILVKSSDDVGHILIDVKINAGKATTIENEYLSSYRTHGYYCIDGEGIGLINNKNYLIKSHTLIVTSTQNSITIKPKTDMRIVSILCVNANTSDTIIRSLEEINGTERDVAWGNGRSRRFLIQKDGMGFTLCNTTGNGNTNSYIQYRNHFESCYYLSGTGMYEWDSGKHSIDTGEKQSTVFIMNEHDRHYMRIKKESVCLSIFTPPIKGDERHNFSHGKVSSY